ncbi:MAG TPA: RebB family R body protein [Myxococcaceae bacterium]|jgi:hypothetical protein
MNKSAHDFARELTAIVDASANALRTLNLVLQQQQQHILTLASAGGVATSSPATGKAPASAATAGTPPEAAPSPVAAPVVAPSPEALLTQAEQSSKALLDHAPDFAIANLYQASVHAVGLALMNTVAAQQQLHIVAQAVVTRGAANHLSAPQVPASAPAEKPVREAPPASPREQAKNARAR